MATNDPVLSNAYRETMAEVRIDKIKQKLFWYDNVPDAETVLSLIMQWREAMKELKDLGVKNSYTED